jgi:hypothetical protein
MHLAHFFHSFEYLLIFVIDFWLCLKVIQQLKLGKNCLLVARCLLENIIIIYPINDTQQKHENIP